jgi:hypothetical protein
MLKDNPTSRSKIIVECTGLEEGKMKVAQVSLVPTD